MDAWVYLFSKFTHEALLFEALALFLGIFGYAIFYLIRKRKYGVAGKEVPSNIMKVYLAQLVGDAEELRTQLFGLLGKGEASARLMANLQFQTDLPTESAAGSGATLAGSPVTATQFVQDPKIAEKLKELEKKLAEQTSALDSVLNEKMKLEEELANAKNNSPSPSDSAGKPGSDKGQQALNERLKQLEAQLAEYAIIEDDLANLKRLQKENKALKQQLADVGAQPAPSLDVAAAKPNASPTPEAGKAAAPDFDPSQKAKPEEKSTAPAPSVPDLSSASPDTPPSPEAKADPTAPAPEKAAAPLMPDTSGPTTPDVATELAEAAAPVDPNQPADFESLVDVVEKNLADAAKSDSVEGNLGGTPPADLQLDAGAPNAGENADAKTEEQLQADFEKMLNS